MTMTVKRVATIQQMEIKMIRTMTVMHKITEICRQNAFKHYPFNFY